ncbi:hypothetical protein PHMEG_00037688, partial [Phytophthora megakarya]
EEEKQAASPERLATVLVNALREASITKPRLQAWLDLAQELFTKICPQTTVKRAALSPVAQRLPRLKKVVVQQQEWRVWKGTVEEACHQMYRTRQSLEYILSKHLGKRAIREAMNNAPVLTQWAAKVTGRADSSIPAETPSYELFRFKLDLYTGDETRNLKQICERTYGKHVVAAYRKCTEDEWEIVKGIVKGNILCCQLPQFSIGS